MLRKRSKLAIDDVFSLIQDLTKSYNEKILELSEKINLFDLRIKTLSDNISSRIDILEKRVELLEEKRTSYSKEVDERVRKINIAIAQQFGRYQLCNLKLEGLKHIGQTADQLATKLLEVEQKLIALETKTV